MSMGLRGCLHLVYNIFVVMRCVPKMYTLPIRCRRSDQLAGGGGYSAAPAAGVMRPNREKIKKVNFRKPIDNATKMLYNTSVATKNKEEDGLHESE